MVESTVKSSITPVVELTEKAPIRVLHVDDEAGFLKASKQILEMQGNFQVDTASSVEEAKEILKRKSFDVVISDYLMPGKNGLEFLKELRNSGNGIPFIMFTGKGREEVAIKALNLGADLYFNKIGDPETVYGELAHGIHQAVETKRAEMEIWRREERLRAIFASSPDAIIISDLNANVVDCNQETLKLTGFASKAEIIGRNSLEFIAEKDRNRALENLKKTLEQGTAKNVEYTLLKKDGEEYQGELSASIIKDSSDNPVGFVGVLRDITERKRLEQVLRKSEKQASAAIEAARALTFSYDIASGKVDWGGAIEEITGYTREEFAKVDVDGWADRIHPDDRDRILPILQEAMGKDRAIAEYRFKTKKGYVTLSSISLTEKQDGKAARLVGILQDITERKKAEIALRESREKLRNIFESANDCIFYVDKSGRIIDVNRKAAQLFGRSRKELFGRHFAKVGGIPLKDMPTVMKAFAQSLAGKQHTLNVCIKDKRGQGIPLECLSSLVKTDGKITGMLVIARDITERKKAEEELKKSEERYRALLEQTPVGIFNLDVKGKITYINKELEEITGYSRDEIQGKNVLSLVRKQGLMSDENLKLATKRMKNTFMGRTGDPLRLPLRRKDGSWIWIEGDSKLIKKLGFPVGLQSIVRDVTKLKEAEESSKKLMEKLGVVGKLTRHDARNKLSTVTMNTFLIKQKLAHDPEALKHLSEIESACGEVEGIFEFARIYEKIGLEELAYMNVEKTLEEAVRLFRDLHDVKIANDCHGLTILADSLLRQLLYNLIDNSLKRGEKVSRIRVYYKEAGKDQLKLVYEDDGVGIPKVEKERIFGEGYGKGTGYGLYLIRKMCEVYGWTIQETGKQGKGAEFTITIPKNSESGKTNYRLKWSHIR